MLISLFLLYTASIFLQEVMTGFPTCSHSQNTCTPMNEEYCLSTPLSVYSICSYIPHNFNMIWCEAQRSIDRWKLWMYSLGYDLSDAFISSIFIKGVNNFKNLISKPVNVWTTDTTVSVSLSVATVNPVQGFWWVCSPILNAALPSLHPVF